MCKPNSPGLLLFAGTTEGRLLAAFCAEQGIGAFVSVATGYGAGLLPVSPHLIPLTGRLDAQGIGALLAAHPIRLVVDATHPFAQAATGNIRAACRAAGRAYVRVLRQDTPRPPGRYFPDLPALTGYLSATVGDILLTTGSKDLEAFCRIPGFARRCTVRVLPAPGAVERCRALGFSPARILAAKGPFSVEENLRHLGGAAFLVTKESGPAGGFGEKAQAARQAGAELVVLARPPEQGLSLGETMDLLAAGAPRHT